MFFGEKIGLIGRKERVSFSSFDSSLFSVKCVMQKFGRAATVVDDDSGGHGGSYYGFNFSFLNPPMARLPGVHSSTQPAKEIGRAKNTRKREEEKEKLSLSLS